MPGANRLPTTSPIASATVDIARKYTNANPPTRPTLAALRTDPMPSTMVQKITGLIIILMRLTNISPSTPTDLPNPGHSMPTATPSATATTTAIYSQWVRSLCFFGGVLSEVAGSVAVMAPIVPHRDRDHSTTSPFAHVRRRTTENTADRPSPALIA
ncbi:Uncharacterised protein [Mycobacteroides abscessus subsp. abscessus]|nr:Uncharacterised protein [Mycobacteroides abscessus subsp. abscessus]